MVPRHERPGIAKVRHVRLVRARTLSLLALEVRVADRHDPVGVAVPEPHGVAGAHDPVAVVAVQVDGDAAERLAPVQHRRVVMRMRDGDGRKPAESADQLHRGAVDQADAVPQHVARRRRHQQGALADPELRRGADAEQPGLVAERVHVGARQPLQRGPALA